jgi:hypothetical protein
VHLSSDGSSWFLRSSFRRLRLLLLVVFVLVLLAAGVVAWRWHEEHLPTPSVPSVWVNFGKGAADEATMFKWVITGQQVSGIYFDDDLTNSGCYVEPFVGRVDGHSVSLTATFLNGSGTVSWSGTVSAHQLDLDDEIYSPGLPTTFAKTLTGMHYPSCGPGAS